MAGFDHLKRTARDRRKAEARTKREQRRQWRRCWWTRPFGHEYIHSHEGEGESTRKRCVSCHKPY